MNDAIGQLRLPGGRFPDINSAQTIREYCLNFYLSVKRRVNKMSRILLRRKEASIHGITVPLEAVRTVHALKEIDRGTYEGSEAALVARYLTPGSTVVELGASLGIISSVIGKTAPARLVCVEAMPELAVSARRLLALNCPGVNSQVIQCAIAASDGVIAFDYTGHDSLAGRVSGLGPKKPHTMQVPAKCLSTILAEAAITGPFFLVSDIEGMEAALFLDDARAFACCSGMILESHYADYRGRQYTPDDVFALGESLGFKLVERIRNVAYLARVPA